MSTMHKQAGMKMSTKSAIAVLLTVVVTMLLLSTGQELRIIKSTPYAPGSYVNPFTSGVLSFRRSQRCAIVQLGDYHMDVVAGFAWALQTAGCRVDVVTRNTTYRIQDTMVNWFEGNFINEVQFQTQSYRYDLVTFTTYPEPMVHYRMMSKIYHKNKFQRYILVVHNPDNVPLRLKQFLVATKYNEAVDRMIFASPGPWVADYLTESVKEGRKNKEQFRQIWIPALFPTGIELETKDKRNLCIQGAIQVFRRDYGSVFNALAHPQLHEALDINNEKLQVAGSGLHDLSGMIASEVSDHIEIMPGLPYDQYYLRLSKCKALITALAPGNATTYLTKKCSSSLATAINLGVPLIVTEREMETYTQLFDRSGAFTYEEETSGLGVRLAGAMRAALLSGPERGLGMLLTREELMLRSVQVARDALANVKPKDKEEEED